MCNIFLLSKILHSFFALQYGSCEIGKKSSGFPQYAETFTLTSASFAAKLRSELLGRKLGFARVPDDVSGQASGFPG
jgi:hypothetical protein